MDQLNPLQQKLFLKVGNEIIPNQHDQIKKTKNH